MTAEECALLNAIEGDGAETITKHEVRSAIRLFDRYHWRETKSKIAEMHEAFTALKTIKSFIVACCAVSSTIIVVVLEAIRRLHGG